VAREGLAVYQRLASADAHYDEERDLELGWLARTLSGLGRHDEAAESYDRYRRVEGTGDAD
jgi:hypothetical protein